MYVSSDSTYAMFSGDVSLNGQVAYIGGGSDKSEILSILGGAGNVNYTYDRGDVNMNGIVHYIGGGNDKSFILQMLGGPGNVVNTHVTN